MKNKINYCNLIYIEYNDIADDIEHQRENIMCKIEDVYANRYYSNLSRNLELNSVVKLKEHYKFNYTNNSVLKYIEIQNIRYKIIKISNISGNRIMLDISEEK